MRNDKLIPGLILVMIGAVILLHNFHLIYFHWGNLWHLWPVLLVIGGINLVFANNKSNWSIILKISVVIAGFALIVLGNSTNRYGRWFWPHGYYNYKNDNDFDNSNDGDDNNSNNDNNDSVDDKGGKSQAFNEPFNANVKVARLNLSGAATSYNLSDTTSQLFSANTDEVIGHYEFTKHQEDSIYVMNFKLQDKNLNMNFDSDNANKVNIKLNPLPVWEFVLNAGAAELNFDLSNFKVKSLELNGGAGSFTVKLGQPLTTTNVNVSTGAADVNLSIPENASCEITSSSAFSSNDYDGFTKNEDGTYTTPGFSTAKNKIYIHLSGGFAGFEVKRY